MKLAKKLFAFDVETTGTDPANFNIIQIGCLILDHDLNTEWEYSSYIRPALGRRNMTSMQCHNIAEDRLASAPDFYTVAAYIDLHLQPAPLKRYVAAAWGTYFDVVFLHAEYRRIGRLFPFVSSFEFPTIVQSFDIRSVVTYEMNKCGLHKWNGISGALEALGLSFEGTPHDALDDIKNSIRLLKFFAFDQSIQVKDKIPT